MSNFSYSLCLLNEKYEIINKLECSITYNNRTNNKILRKNINIQLVIPEDIKIFPSLIKGKLIGICNILIRIKPNIFKVGLIELDIKKLNINIIKIFNIENELLEEKNWLIVNNNNRYFIIYTLLPRLIIYKLDISNFNLSLHQKTDTFELIKYNFDFKNLHINYRHLIYTPVSFLIDISLNTYYLILRKKINNNYYEYYESILSINNDVFKLDFYNNLINSGHLLYLNDMKYINKKIIKCYGINDHKYNIEESKIRINIGLNINNNFYNDIYLHILSNLININKYEICYNTNNINLNIIIDTNITYSAYNKYYCYSLLNDNNINIPSNIDFLSVRGPLSRNILLKKNNNVPEIYGNLLLLISKYYTPIIITEYIDKIIIITDSKSYDLYLNTLNNDKYIIIDINEEWTNIINKIYSCKSIISLTLEGIILADSYNKPNILLKNNEINSFLLKDYYLSQNRELIIIDDIFNLKEDENINYNTTNIINIEKLIEIFPFK
jgi:pyruvyltransferase